MDNIPMEVVANVLGTEPGVLAESLKAANGSPEILQTVLKEQLAKRDGQIRKSIHDEGHGRGKREALGAVEKAWATKYEISDYQGLDGLLDAILQKNTAATKMNPDDVKQSEVYQTEIRLKNDEIAKINSAFKNFKLEIENQNIRNLVSSAATSIIEKPEHKYVIPSKTPIKENLLKTFQEAIFKDVKYDVRDNKIIGVLKSDGDLVRDDNMLPLSFDDYVHKVAKGYFDQASADDRSGTGANTQGSQGGSGGTSGPFNYSDREAFMSDYLKQTDPATRSKMAAYDAERTKKGDW